MASEVRQSGRLRLLATSGAAAEWRARDEMIYEYPPLHRPAPQRPTPTAGTAATSRPTASQVASPALKTEREVRRPRGRPRKVPVVLCNVSCQTPVTVGDTVMTAPHHLRASPHQIRCYTTRRPYPTGLEGKEHVRRVKSSEVAIPTCRAVCCLDKRGLPVITILPDGGTASSTVPAAALPSGPPPHRRRRSGLSTAREEDLSDDRFARRHHSLAVGEMKRRRWGSHLTRFALEQQLRKEREEQRARELQERLQTAAAAAAAANPGTGVALGVLGPMGRFSRFTGSKKECIQFKCSPQAFCLFGCRLKLTCIFIRHPRHQQPRQNTWHLR